MGAMKNRYFDELQRRAEGDAPTLTDGQINDLLHAIAPLVREQERRCAVGDSDLDNEQPIPSLSGVQLGHLRAAVRADRALRRFRP